ncbi:MAG: AAA family ATPase, partial [Pirellulaceae bacterium]
VQVASVLQKLNNLAAARASTPTGGGDGAAPARAIVLRDRDEDTESEPSEFLPREPRSLKETGLTETEIEALLFKFLLAKGDATGRSAADQVKLPFVLLEDLFRRLKNEQLLVYRDSAPMGDYVYQLTDMGRERARRLAEVSSYFGAAPVLLSDYSAAMKAQSLETQHPTEVDLRRAFSDLLISPTMLERLGPAINSGRGLFLFGAPGNGKTSIAERVTRAFGQYIWIPRAITIDGEILRVYDPVTHEEAVLDRGDGLLDTTRVDKRWVRIKRPTIVVGGELTMEHLEVSFNPATGTSEAPVQLKSNCGTLVIDDFGRQRMTTDQLLNRWIVPLEKRYDFLNLASGKKIQVPFDQLVIFSTNLEPKDLVDEAFLRRIPYKIEVIDPTEDAFRQLFRLVSPRMGMEYNEEAVQYLIDNHYKRVGRPFRSCQPRDLLLQVRNHCYYQGVAPQMTPESFDFATANYFSVL